MMNSPSAYGVRFAISATLLAIAAACVALGTSDIPSPAPGTTTAETVAQGVRESESPDADAEPPETLKALISHATIVGHSIEGRPISCIQLGGGDCVILFLASIHGNESAGTPLVQRLLSELILQPELVANATVVVLPVVNPDGVAATSRFNANGVDLNRNFPADNRENSRRYGMDALSEPEALAVYQTIERFMPNQIVTLHEPLQCVDYDGPARDLAVTMGSVSPLPVRKLGSRPGSLGAFAGETLGIPTITLELPKNAATQSPELLWQFYGPVLLAAVEFRASKL